MSRAPDTPLPEVAITPGDVVGAIKGMDDPAERVAFAAMLTALSDLGRIATAFECIASALEKGKS